MRLWRVWPYGTPMPTVDYRPVYQAPGPEWAAEEYAAQDRDGKERRIYDGGVLLQVLALDARPDETVALVHVVARYQVTYCGNLQDAESAA